MNIDGQSLEQDEMTFFIYKGFDKKAGKSIVDKRYEWKSDTNRIEEF